MAYASNHLEAYNVYDLFCALKDKIVAGVEARIAAWTLLPAGRFVICSLSWMHLFFSFLNVGF